MILKPQRLKYSDIAALIAPSGFIKEEKFLKAHGNIKKLGLVPVYINTYGKNYGYLSDTDDNRLTELNIFLKDKIMTKAIFCVRGGYGATRILEKIDYNAIKKNPKVFVGFSDITALQSAFYIKSGLVSFHGIVAASEFSDYTNKQINDLIFNPVENYKLPVKSFKVLKKGKAEGKIVGGNLSLLSTLIGTEYLYKFENNIVFIEEIFEPPYKIDRMLNHLLMTTDLRKASAIVFGNFNKCEPQDHKILKRESFTVEQIIKQYFSKFKIPIVYNVNFGHIIDGLVFPIGINALIDTKLKEIRLLETAVI